MKQPIVTIVALVVGALIGAGIVARANPQGVKEDTETRTRMALELAKEFVWLDDEGQPFGVADENWLPVSENLGAIWRSSSDGLDQLIWVVHRDGLWRAAEPFDFNDVYRYRQGG